MFFWFPHLRWKLTAECGEGLAQQKRCSAEPVPVWVQKLGLGEPKPRILGPRHQPGTRVKSIAKIVEILKIAKIPPVRFFLLISSPTSPIFSSFRPVLKLPATNIFSAWYAAAYCGLWITRLQLRSSGSSQRGRQWLTSNRRRLKNTFLSSNKNI